jgi:flavin reductase (DIM6/NTAB) family NADH-FMN oxidoreductase RutF
VQPYGDHDLILGEAVAFEADEDKLDDNGRPDPEKLNLLVYSYGTYWTLGKKLGKHGFTASKLK